MSTPSRLALLPRDGLFCKDGRGWHTSASGRGHALDWPWPSTVLGALRTAWGRGEEARIDRRFERGDWPARTASIALHRTLALRRPPGEPWSFAHRVWPVPADALWLEGRLDVFRLDPRPPRLSTLGVDDDEAREALWVPCVDDPAKPLRGPRWWREEHLDAWLAGTTVPAHPQGGALQTERRVQAHVGIQPGTLTANEGSLFSHDVIETLEQDAEWALGVEVDLPGGSDPVLATLGSDRRLARVERLPGIVFDPPAAVTEAFRKGSPGLRLIVVSPTAFSHGWRPDGLDRQGDTYRGRLPGLDAELVLRAAIVPRPIHISGWDMAANNGRGAPKLTARMVPPGAVYFFERTDGRPFGEAEARALWLAALGDRTGEGFGRVIPGTWFPKRSAS